MDITISKKRPLIPSFLSFSNNFCLGMRSKASEIFALPRENDLHVRNKKIVFITKSLSTVDKNYLSPTNIVHLLNCPRGFHAYCHLFVSGRGGEDLKLWHYFGVKGNLHKCKPFSSTGTPTPSVFYLDLFTLEFTRSYDPISDGSHNIEHPVTEQKGSRRISFTHVCWAGSRLIRVSCVTGKKKQICHNV